VYLGEALADLCCDSCAHGGECESPGLGFTLPEGLTTSSDGNGSFSWSDVAGQALSFLSPDGMSSGSDIINAVAMGLNAVPGVGPIASSIVSTFGPALSSILHIGAGRTEADIITGPPNHVQDAVFNRIVAISQVGLSSTSVPQLQALAAELQQLRAAWLTFLGNTSHFRDGRASQQAANTIMPYIDGTCGYHWPPPLNPGQTSGCGGAWPNDSGYGAGLLGALLRRIVDNGGQISSPQLTQGTGPFGPSLQTPIPGLPMLPQGGYLPPVAPLSTIRSAGIFPVGSSGISMPIAIGGAAALALLLMRFR
jgi:hypothetical protein